ncbi:phage tail terminator family protein [Paenibacillus glucanolyticus]|uniref:phage tail terminator family protein n=1 Tax=Paenibacillus glucanolyticus TaxID=59843 RepID=UPI0036A10F52
MLTQHISEALTTKVSTSFPGIPLITKEDADPQPPAPYFQTELTLAEFEPISTHRYAARFRFRIHYVPVTGRPVSTIIDEMLESLTSLDVSGRPCRASSVAWERPTGNDGAGGEGCFRAEYVIQMTTDQFETETKMQTLKQGGELK